MMLAIALVALASSPPACSGIDCGRIPAAIRRCRDVPETQRVFYFREENVLCFKGHIAWGGSHWQPGPHLQELRRLDIRMNPIVVASSRGGELTNAILITELLEQYHYTVVADDLCMSACAQFLFMGADHRFVAPGAGIAIHTGPMTREQIAALIPAPEVRARVIEANQRFIDFYRERGLPMALFDFPAAVRARMRPGAVMMWGPTQQDYRRLGIAVTFCRDAPGTGGDAKQAPDIDCSPDDADRGDADPRPVQPLPTSPPQVGGSVTPPPSAGPR